MSVETHWICDVCGKREVTTGERGPDRNETGIQHWFTVTLSIGHIQGRTSTQYKYGYACSAECVAVVVEHLKKEIMKKF